MDLERRSGRAGTHDAGAIPATPRASHRAAIGTVKLAQLTVPTVRAFEDRLRAGRSPAMVRKVLGCSAAILADAQERGLVAQTLCAACDRRRRGKDRPPTSARRASSRSAWTSRTRTRSAPSWPMLEGRWRPMLLTAIFTGLRASELRGLRWADVDLKRGEIHVRQRADRYNEIGPPKSEAGERTCRCRRWWCSVARVEAGMPEG